MTKVQILQATRKALELHSKYGIDVTGLGWTAKREFLIYDADTVYCANSGSGRTPFTKTNDGWAICAIVTNANDHDYGGGDWTWPYLISTDYDSVLSSTPISAGYTGVEEYDHLGLHWYCGCRMAYNQDWGGATDVISDYPVFDWEGAQGGVVNGIGITEETFERLMALAGVTAFTGGTLPVLSTAPGVGT